MHIVIAVLLGCLATSANAIPFTHWLHLHEEFPEEGLSYTGQFRIGAPVEGVEGGHYIQYISIPNVGHCDPFWYGPRPGDCSIERPGDLLNTIPMGFNVITMTFFYPDSDLDYALFANGSHGGLRLTESGGYLHFAFGALDGVTSSGFYSVSDVPEPHGALLMLAVFAAVWRGQCVSCKHLRTHPENA